jgi:hypothetical protein
MSTIQAERLLRKIPRLGEESHAVSRTIHRGVLAGGQPIRDAADFLHGTWLGHPLHAVLTDFTVGAWVLGTVFDLIGFAGRSKSA